MSSDLQIWLKNVNAAKSRVDVFRLVEQFRPMEWTDEQRAVMAKTYMRALDRLAPGEGSKSDAATTETEGPDGPVWYEKM